MTQSRCCHALRLGWKNLSHPAVPCAWTFRIQAEGSALRAGTGIAIGLIVWGKEPCRALGVTTPTAFGKVLENIRIKSKVLQRTKVISNQGRSLQPPAHWSEADLGWQRVEPLSVCWCFIPANLGSCSPSSPTSGDSLQKKK